MRSRYVRVLTFALGFAGVAALGSAASAQDAQGTFIAPGLVIPHMDPMNGKKLFAIKGCVVCHQVHGVGGTDSPSLDISKMDPVMSPFDFFAKMWRGADKMIEMQDKELGYQVKFTGQELADIVAFLHDRKAEQSFTEADIPDNIKKLMDEDEDSGSSMGSGGGMMRRGGMMGK